MITLSSVSWRETCALPSSRIGLRGTRVGKILHVSGGYPDTVTDKVLAWDTVAETWVLARKMAAVRGYHGVTELDMAVVAQYCSV